MKFVLQIVIHGDDEVAAGVPQPGHDRVVLAVIARVFEVGERHLRPEREVAAHRARIIGAAVIDQDDLEPAGGAQRRLFRRPGRQCRQLHGAQPHPRQ